LMVILLRANLVLAADASKIGTHHNNGIIYYISLIIL
jgi:hypothetical protein